MNKDYIIYPKQGLGKIKFGTSPNEMETLYHIYGTPDYIEKDEITLDNEIERLKDIYSEQEIINSFEQYIQNGGGKVFLSQSWKNQFSLDFVDNKLSIISINYTEKVDVCLFDINVFLSQSHTLIKTLIEILGEKPLVSGNELIFKDNFIYLWGYHKFTDSGKLIFTEDTANEDDVYEKFVLLTSKKRDVDEDYTLYEPFDLNRSYNIETLPYR